MNPTAHQLQQWRAEAKAGKRILVIVSDEAWEFHQMGMPGGRGRRYQVEEHHNGGVLCVSTWSGPRAMGRHVDWDSVEHYGMLDRRACPTLPASTP